MSAEETKARLKVDSLVTSGHEEELEPEDREPVTPDDSMMNFDMLEEVPKVFSRHVFALMACMLSGLLTLMFVPSVASLLDCTDKTSSPLGAFKRYLSTTNHIVAWYKSPQARQTSLKKVRRLHARLSALGRVRVGKGVTQLDMAIAQWAFIGPVIQFPENNGLARATEREIAVLNHLMYVVGAVLGQDDRYNLCAGTLSESRAACSEMHRRVILPLLNAPLTPLAHEMSQFMLSGAAMIHPFIFPATYESWTRRRLGADRVRSKFDTLAETFVYHSAILCFEFFLVNRWTRDVVACICNALMRLNIFLANILRERIVSEQKDKDVNQPRDKWSKFKRDEVKDEYEFHTL